MVESCQDVDGKPSRDAKGRFHLFKSKSKKQIKVTNGWGSEIWREEKA